MRVLFVVDPAGQIRVCNHSVMVVGNIFSTPIISDVGYWNMFSLSRHKPDVCRTRCPVKDLCDCGCREAANILCGSPAVPDITLFDPSL